MIAGRHPIAVGSALASSLRYGKQLGIPRGEWSRYLRKSANCALCYVGLGQRRGIVEAWRAGQAAFVSTAFDVLTDWRPIDDAGARTFRAIVASFVVDSTTRQVAEDLFVSKRNGAFGHDGLERGIGALRYIVRVMGCEPACLARWGDLDVVGETLQLIDDILDFEDDVRRGELTCLTSPRARTYLGTFIHRHETGELARWFGRDRTVLRLDVDRAVERARQLHDALPPAVTS